MTISKLLVANRGEIAVRVVRACSDLGIHSVVAFSEADRLSMAVQMADQSVCIGPARASDSYLNVGAVIAAALGTGVDAIHPGYGFLAEHPTLALKCIEFGIGYVGPRPDSLQQLGNKLDAKELARSCGVPLLGGSERITSPRQAVVVAEAMGFPVLLKAAAGGGGRGIRFAPDADHLSAIFSEATAEAAAAFGDGTLFLERFVQNARHIEVQILGDRAGNIIHLGERDCSIQRRYQKVVEEAPSSSLPDHVRDAICAAAVKIAHQIRYESAGTVEFIVDQDSDDFYFIEVNPRIQVEHPVTEMITGIDIVKEQLRIAGNQRPAVLQAEVVQSGHAIECRVVAEAPSHDFRPSPGTITEWHPPTGRGIRVDTHCFAGYFVPPHYDSLIAKLVVHGRDRPEALTKVSDALRDFHVRGIETNIQFLQAVVDNTEFRAGTVNTRSLARWGFG